MAHQTTCQIIKNILASVGVKSASDFTDFSLGAKVNRERNRDIVSRVVFNGDTLQSAGTIYGINKETVRGIAYKTSRKLAKTKGVDFDAAYRERTSAP